MEKLGIDQIKKVLALILELGNVGDYIGKHPELGVAKFAKLTELFDELMAMGSFSVEEFKKQYADLDEAEIAELKLFMKEKFNIEDDVLEGKIEQGLDLFAEGFEFVQKVIAFGKAMKA